MWFGWWYRYWRACHYRFWAADAAAWERADQHCRRLQAQRP
jgi:hypothetical protein